MTCYVYHNICLNEKDTDALIKSYLFSEEKIKFEENQLDNIRLPLDNNVIVVSTHTIQKNQFSGTMYTKCKLTVKNKRIRIERVRRITPSQRSIINGIEKRATLEEFFSLIQHKPTSNLKLN